ncbi:glycerophosphodiester phosphodiesterase [Cryptosporangium sp. NPDC051539]|uniref:glycerophosphodiester phosphodiesterase n=1 Tax=Cryptosporangium sp. NPDC051539 TaxID=3363962 RepID=UPI00379B7785
MSVPRPTAILNRVPLPYLDAPRPLAFAHRGGAAHGFENTMTAFSQAVDAGYRYVETDVHATADGALVAFHDRTLDRVTDRSGAIAALPLTEVRAARIGGTEQVPLFDELLDAWPDVRINIDVKADAAVEPLVEAVREHRAEDRVCVGSFSDARLRRVRAAFGGSVATSLGPRDVARLKLASLTGSRPRFGPGVCAAQVPVRHGGLRVVDARFVAAAHRAGLQVHVWTIDDATTMHRLLDLGVDGIMTDRIDVLRDVLTSRGQWAA